MKQVQINIPDENTEQVREVLGKYSSDILSMDGESDEEKITVLTATVESEDVDELSKELKSIKELDSGELKIRLIDQQALIEKGQKTRGSSTKLSQEEVYSKAQESSTFNRPQWMLMGLSSAIAAYGLMLNNIAVVIGAMMLAPVLSPIVSSSIALTVGDGKLLKEGLFTGIGGGLLAILISGISVIPFNPTVNSTMNLIVSAGLENLLLSLFVGSAAALAFVTGYRDQIAGVAVAVALVPPLAAAGIGLRVQNLFFTYNAVSLALINLLAVLVSGSVSLKLLGFKPSTYYKKKTAERLRYVLPVAVVVMLAVATILLMNPY
ncbi:TIGR00341 family protein [Candidatus Nanosalina sp. VS9-1]|uniref:TIGR00341 family protein n=1 Tax=Candidatus Nanosalina sp. VS9-1 TaxID=3388566 RepID=UPI0039E05129